MEATLSRDPQNPQYALIKVHDCPELPAGTDSCTIQRSSDFMYLSSDGIWAGDMKQISGLSQVRQDGDLLVRLPLAIFTDMDSMESYWLSIGPNSLCPMTMPEELNVYADHVTGGVQGVAGGFKSPVQPVAPPVINPEPAPAAAEPEPPAAPAAAPASDGPDLTAKAESKYDTLALDADGSEPPAKSGKGPLIVIIIAVLVLIAAAAFFLLRSQPDTQANGAGGPAQAEQSAPAPASEPAPALLPETAASEPEPAPLPEAAAPAAKAQTAAPAGSQSPLTEARQLLREGVDATAALEKAKALRTPEAGENECDSAFLLLEEAAQNGNAEAMFLLAQYYDPVCVLPRGSIQEDAGEALAWYKKARDAGNAQASSSVQRVIGYLESRAAAGDQEARRLLKNR